MRVNCDVCGEEIINKREIKQNGLTLCKTCAYDGYYQKIAEAHFTLPDLLPALTHQ